MTTSQQYNENENHPDNNTFEKNNEMESKTMTKGLKRLKSPQHCSKKLKYSETTNNTNSEFEGLVEQLSQYSKCTKTFPNVNNSNSYDSQNVSIENSTVKNNEVCNQNQLVCLNPDTNAQPKWVEDLMCLLHKLDSDYAEHKFIDPAL